MLGFNDERSLRFTIIIFAACGGNCSCHCGDVNKFFHARMNLKSYLSIYPYIFQVHVSQRDAQHKADVIQGNVVLFAALNLNARCAVNKIFQPLERRR
jgi:hypothetical protein